MCQDCGCSDIPEGMVKIHAHDHSHDRDHPHPHDHEHPHDHSHEHIALDSDRRTIYEVATISLSKAIVLRQN